MKKLIYLMMSLFFFAAVGSVCLTAAAEETSVTWDYEQDFASAESVNADFNAYYLTKFMGILSQEKVTEGPDANKHWYVQDGAISRANDIGAQLNADSIAMLTLTKKKYTNFRMQVDILQGTQTAFWGAFCVRQDQPGKMFFEDGTGVYVEQEGNIRIWGYELNGGPFLCGKVDNYDKSQWYTYDITVDGNLMTVQIGDNDAVVIRLPWTYYREGYITLMSINNNSSFRNLKIKELPDTEQIGSDVPADQAKPSPDDAEDSLDNLAGNTNQNDAINDIIPSPAAPKSNTGLIIGLSIGGGVAVVAAVAVCVVFILRKKKKQ